MKRKVENEIDKLDAFIDYYMEGNLNRFLRKHNKQYFFQLTYTHTLRKIKQSSKKTYKKLIKEKLYPNRLRDYLNIFITLKRHYNVDFTYKAFQELLEVEEELLDIMQPYMKDIYSTRWEIGSKYKKVGWVSSKQAFKEQKARGFIHINDFELFDPKANHIRSNVNTNYYYPLNLYPLSQDSSKSKTTIVCQYILSSLYSVSGHTRMDSSKKKY